MKRLLLIPAIVGVLSGCAAHSWAPGPNQTAANFGQASGQCKLLAMGANSGGGFVAAQGSPQFVGAYTGAVVLAGAIGGAVRQHQAYEACMEAQGFVPVAVQPPA
jgi:hypothetical protein